MGSKMTEAAIRTSALSKYFGHVRAVDGLTMEVPSGIVFGFLGQNGAGKTTTIQLLLGLLEPTSGDAQVLGYDLRERSDLIRERTGVLLEYKGLYERMNALDNLEFYGRIWHLPKNELDERSKELLTHFDLWDRRNEKIGNYSKGMKAKLAVARTLLHRPPLIFLDEPTDGLDPVAAVALRDDLVKLASKEDVTVFLTSHNMPEVEKICNKISDPAGQAHRLRKPGRHYLKQDDPDRGLWPRLHHGPPFQRQKDERCQRGDHRK